ncbi:hypothetical protein Dsin_033165 [Dipteronia sinensis]|uniref:Uncharacterized protein n=1 Tax=Dipteronia sinensis TaxID=43782 RepID=A0AAD9Z784_9ROSI|nr:hypothetical protein Dsin_033165 [Dipteronia sinensis]
MYHGRFRFPLDSRSATYQSSVRHAHARHQRRPAGVQLRRRAVAADRASGQPHDGRRRARRDDHGPCADAQRHAVRHVQQPVQPDRRRRHRRRAGGTDADAVRASDARPLGAGSPDHADRVRPRVRQQLQADLPVGRDDPGDVSGETHVAAWIRSAGFAPSGVSVNRVVRTDRRGGDALRHSVRSALVLATLCGLASCKTPKLLCLAPSGLKEIAVRSDATANGGRPIAVDLLFVTDKKVMAEVGDLKARDYFARRPQLVRKYRKGWLRTSWELQTGQYVPAERIKPPCNLIATLVLADYAGEATDVLRLEKAKTGTLLVQDDGLHWQASED